jgi:hemerythrin-like domain-containing protein
VNDPIAMLKRDHREVSAMLKELADAKPGAKRRKLTEKVASELSLHMDVEEQFIYPVVEQRVGEEEEQEAEVEHGLAREGVAKMRELVDEPGFGAAVAMVTAGIEHHVKEEESEVFPELKRKLDRDELAKIGDEVAAAKAGNTNGRRRTR